MVAHQANLRIIDAVIRQLDLPEGAVIAHDVVESRKTSPRSVPLALSKLTERGGLTPGAPVRLLAFGGGPSWAGRIVVCP
jgi:3-oxoacyl-[acyl-carrier-protein] synthase III